MGIILVVLLFRPSTSIEPSNFITQRHRYRRHRLLSSHGAHSNAYAVLSPLAATMLMAQTQSIIVTYTGFHVFGTHVCEYGGGERNSTL